MQDLIFSALGLALTLRNNEIKYIMKVIKSFKNRKIFLNRTTNKILVKKEDLSFRPLMSVGLPLMENALTSLAKSVLIPLGIMAAASATDVAI